MQEITKLPDLVSRYIVDSLDTLNDEFKYLKVSARIDFSPKRVTHRGGLYAKGPGINLAGNLITNLYNNQKRVGSLLSKFNEYPSYSKDPIIGSVIITDWTQYVKLVVAHEVAHACQQYLRFRDKLENEAPHGTLFKSIYRTIRLSINSTLPDQIVYSKMYNDKLGFIKKVEYKL